MLERLSMLRRKERYHKAVDKDDDVRGLWVHTWFLAGGGEYTAGNQAPKREGNSPLFFILYPRYTTYKTLLGSSVGQTR
jgi:hypothetical protein